VTKQLLTEIAEEAASFVAGCRSLMLATTNDSGDPHASYTPFWRSVSGNYYIYVSTLSSHTANLENGRASILLIEDEREARQIFTRTRVGFQCDVVKIDRDSERYPEIISALGDVHGEIVNTLESLPDFMLFQLRPAKGRFIRGFGQAYEVDAAFTRVCPISGP
jgi:putative heme iron utilization protein